jgi:hypothetical protein
MPGQRQAITDATWINDLRLKVPRLEVRIDEPLTLSFSYRVQGRLRETFTQDTWERAYEAHDNYWRVTYRIELLRRVGGLFRQRLMKPIRIVRRATLYWSRNPDLPYRIWAMIINEDRVPSLPKSEQEAQAAFFDVAKSVDLIGSDLGRGTHALALRVQAKWGRHVIIAPGACEGQSAATRLRVQ